MSRDNPHLRETHSGEKDLILVRITRTKKGGPMLLMPGTITTLAVVSGKENLNAYLNEQLAEGPFRFWIAMLGDIPESSFAEGHMRAVPEINLK